MKNRHIINLLLIASINISYADTVSCNSNKTNQDFFSVDTINQAKYVKRAIQCNIDATWSDYENSDQKLPTKYFDLEYVEGGDEYYQINYDRISPASAYVLNPIGGFYTKYDINKLAFRETRDFGEMTKAQNLKKESGNVTFEALEGSSIEIIAGSTRSIRYYDDSRQREYDKKYTDERKTQLEFDLSKRMIEKIVKGTSIEHRVLNNSNIGDHNDVFLTLDNAHAKGEGSTFVRTSDSEGLNIEINISCSPISNGALKGKEVTLAQYEQMQDEKHQQKLKERNVVGSCALKYYPENLHHKFDDPSYDGLILGSAVLKDGYGKIVSKQRTFKEYNKKAAKLIRKMRKYGFKDPDRRYYRLSDKFYKIVKPILKRCEDSIKNF